MRPETAPQGEPAGPVRVRFQVRFSRGPKGQRRAREGKAPAPASPPPKATEPEAGPKPVPTASVPRITRLLVLGHHFERLVREGKVKNYAEIARLTGLSRARVTQMVNLTLLEPDIEEAILFLAVAEGRSKTAAEGDLRRITAATDWSLQRDVWRRLRRTPWSFTPK